MYPAKVSENGKQILPDILFLPIITDYFKISIDYLLGQTICRQKEGTKEACESADIISKDECANSITILRNALIRHSCNEALMYKLLWTLSGIFNEFPDNCDEAILLYIPGISTDTKMPNKVTRDLMYRYYTKGEYAESLYYAEDLPPFNVYR